MNTEDLIDSLSRDAASLPRHGVSILLVTLLGGTVSLVCMLVLLGLRTEWQGVEARWGLAMKLMFASLVVALGLFLLRPASRPEVSLQGRMKIFMLPLALIVLMVAVSLLMRSPDFWISAVLGDTLLVCLSAIPLLAMPILAGLLLSLKKGAVSDGRRAGMLAGLLAGATAVLVYSLHCIEDDPAFYGIWYTSGVLIVMLAGGSLGKRLLRW